jgi:AAA15 family ATPase/GTPase
MIKKIEIENFRCYKKYIIDFTDLSVIVGKNNAGKSTLIEALRLVSLASNRYRNLAFRKPPTWADLPKAYWGVSPSIKGIQISMNGLFYLNGKSPAKIIVYLEKKSKIELVIGDNGEIFAVIIDEDGFVIENKSQALKCELPEINILPQIGPLRIDESLLNEEYVRSNIFSSLSSLHFRNQLDYFSEYFSEFKRLSEVSWEKLKIDHFFKGDLLYDKPPVLLIKDNEFIGEVGSMGHGLQMWLQTMWFIARCNASSIVILDEPDVYLHADMQRKLINFLKNRFQQVIVATHSVEIISEVEPDNILIINKEENKSKFLNNLPAVQEVINNIGSVHNLELIKYWSIKKFLILEGPKDDIKILQILQSILFLKRKIDISDIPKGDSAGWTGWQKVLGANTALRGSGVNVYCVFDSDYHLKDDIRERYRDAKKHGVNICIWKKKEIENYLIIPSAIFRIINRNYSKGSPNIENIKNQILIFAEELKNDIYDSYSDVIHDKNRNYNGSRCNQLARDLVDSKWNNFDDIISTIPGKTILKSLSDWSKKEFNVSFSKFQIALELLPTEINDELKDFLLLIQK